jgi:hypothetical protein
MYKLSKKIFYSLLGCLKVENTILFRRGEVKKKKARGCGKAVEKKKVAVLSVKIVQRLS